MSLKPYYDEDGIQIWHGECETVLPLLDKADMVLTDPPYNFGFDYDGYSDDLDPADYLDWCRRWFTECARIAPRVVIFPGHGNLPSWWEIRKPSGVGCWYKPGNPAGAGVFQFCEWEPFLLYGKGMGGSDVVRATISRQPDTGGHPCPKPLGLMKQLLLKAKASSVVDPFMGSGSTLVAAKSLGVEAIGIEQSAHYCDIAIDRLRQGVLDFGAAS